MHRKIFIALKYLFLLAIAAGLLWFAFRGVNVRMVFSEMLKANIFWVLLSVSFSVIALISRAYRWNLLIESTGYSPALKKTFYALSIGYFANLAFPRLGEVIRCGSLSKAEKIPFSNLIGTVVVERVIDVVSLFICLALAAILEYKRLGAFLHENITRPLSEKFSDLMGSPLFVIGFIVVITGTILASFFYIRYVKQKGKKSKWSQWLKGFMDGLKSIATLKRPGVFIFHSVLIWVLYYLSAYVCFFALPATSQLGFGAALFILAAGGLAISAPVQGGIGAYHLLVSQGLVLYGLSREVGLTFATLLHSLQTILVVVLGIISLLLIFQNKKEIRNKTEKNTE